MLSPPLSLLTYPPLSQYTNLVLTSFNQLRYAQPTLSTNRSEAVKCLCLVCSIVCSSAVCASRQCTPWALVDGLQASFLQHLQAALKVRHSHLVAYLYRRFTCTETYYMCFRLL